jgi:RNA polymerase sigma factor (sigma-70 family)
VSHIVNDVERARDIVQETFLRLVGARRSWTGNHLVAWLYTVSRNMALDVRRKEARMKPLNESSHPAALTDATAPCAGLERKEEAGRVIDAFETLPSNQREAIHLKFNHGLRYRDIARIMGTSVSNARYLVHVGLGRIRELVSCPEPECREGGVA